MGGIITLLIGVALGYFFKPQLDTVVGKALKAIRDNRDKMDRD